MEVPYAAHDGIGDMGGFARLANCSERSTVHLTQVESRARRHLSFNDKLLFAYVRILHFK